MISPLTHDYPEKEAEVKKVNAALAIMLMPLLMILLAVSAVYILQQHIPGAAKVVWLCSATALYVALMYFLFSMVPKEPSDKE